MGQFLEELLPIDVRMGASYSDDYAVEITTTAAGAEYRKLIHALPARTFSINYTLLRDDIAARVLALYHRAYGKYAGFRVRCFDDFSSNAHTGTPTALDQPAVYISSGVYQLVKEYGAGGTPLGIGRPRRTIYKPKAGTVLIAVNGTPLGAGISVNTTTGRVTLTPAPSGGDVVTAGFEFDLPCRFDSTIDIAALSKTVRDCGSIEIKELLVP